MPWTTNLPPLVRRLRSWNLQSCSIPTTGICGLVESSLGTMCPVSRVTVPSSFSMR